MTLASHLPAESVDVAPMTSAPSDSVPKFGSARWADKLLRLGIASLGEAERVGSSRLAEYFSQVELLQTHGYSWHVRCLKWHLHRVLRKDAGLRAALHLQPASPADSHSEGVGGSSK